MAPSSAANVNRSSSNAEIEQFAAYFGDRNKSDRLDSSNYWTMQSFSSQLYDGIDEFVDHHWLPALLNVAFRQLL